MRKPVFLLLALALVLSFSSCSKEKQDAQPYSGNTTGSESSQTSDAPKEQETPKNDVWVEYFDKYFDTGKSTELTNKAMDLLTAKCMKDKGFDYKIGTKKDNRVSTFPFQNKIVGDPDWGTTDVEYAKIYGYLPPQVAFMFYENIPSIKAKIDTFPKAPQEEQDRFDPTKPEIAGIEASKHTPEYDQAYDGDNGCSKTGETSFYDGLNVDASRSGEVGQLSIKIKEIAMNDVSFAPKLGQWSACVKTKGFDFEVPPGSKISKTDVLDKGNPVYGVNNELIAAADAECKQQVGFIEEWHKVLDTVEERELKNNLPIFEAEKAYTDSMINRANEIIEKYGNEFK